MRVHTAVEEGKKDGVGESKGTKEKTGKNASVAGE
jgi:hypothetical protein